MLKIICWGTTLSPSDSHSLDSIELIVKASTQITTTAVVAAYCIIVVITAFFAAPSLQA